MLVSFIIPAHNAAATIQKTLASFMKEDLEDVEVILVDDFSEDDTPALAALILCKINGRMIQTDEHSGAGIARNRGAEAAQGEVLVFIDADCLIKPGLIDSIKKEAEAILPGTILGGTYTPLSSDGGFFSDFQSVFINYSETKHPESPDYIPTHLMIIGKEDFFSAGGFREDFLPILEDVEFSHRAREQGFHLRMIPSLQVGHIFNYTFLKSLKNAFRKSFYWTIYSLSRRDIFRDSGTASRELKVNILSWLVTLLLIALALFPGNFTPLLFSIPVNILNIILNKDLLAAFFRSGGPGFGLSAAMYYLCIYPLPVLTGGVLGGMATPFFRKRLDF
jgi:glycosyltransferase involved in cell wall biosynthesis